MFVNYIFIVVMFFSISQNMDVIVAILPFIAPFGMLMFYVNITRASMGNLAYMIE
jgi:hypothetical protein